MLAPANRLTLIDALRPPADHVFDSAAAVTFTLDLRAMLAAPAAFALASTTASGGDEAAEPVELLHAIRSHADRITVFAQAGQIALPSSRRVFSFLERSVVSVTAPHGGIVHPKVWLVRYTDSAGAARHRVLIGSRNLTFDGSWDTLLRLDEAEGGGGVGLGALRELFDGMLGRTVGPIDDDHRARVEDLSRSLDDVRFALPQGIDGLRLHVLGLDGTEPRPLPTDADRSFVISPFLSSDFFNEVLDQGPELLVSRQESLDELEEHDLAGVGSPYVFDDGSTPDVDDESWSADDPARPLRGMHAKVFAFELGRRATVFTGSANASGRAFGRNVEVLAELHGPGERLGIDALCGDVDVESGEIGLRRLFQTYIRSDELLDDAAGSSSTLESARLQLGAMPITAEVSGEDPSWAVRYRSTRPVSLPDGVEAHCRPLTVSGNRRELVHGSPIDHRFEVSLEAITAFLAVELRCGDDESRFVVPVDLVNLPERRNRELLRLMIGNADRFLRYLLALLADDPADLNLLDAIDQAVGETDGPARSSGAGLPVLESMLKSLRTDPRRLLSVDPLVRDLADTEDGLPDGFVETWDSIVANAREALT